MTGQPDKFDNKKVCVITGTSSGLGRHTTRWLLENGGWHVICAVRDVDKMAAIAEMDDLDPKSFTIMECDLLSFDSVKSFTKNLLEYVGDAPIDRFVKYIFNATTMILVLIC